LNIARASIGETRSQLYVAQDLGYIDTRVFERLKEKCEAVSRQIWNFMKYLKKPKRL
jgi:four helix bundle protein